MELRTGPQLQESFLNCSYSFTHSFSVLSLGIVYRSVYQSSDGTSVMPGNQAAQGLQLSLDSDRLLGDSEDMHCHCLSLCPVRDLRAVSSGALQATNLTMMLLNLMSDHECRFPYVNLVWWYSHSHLVSPETSGAMKILTFNLFVLLLCSWFVSITKNQPSSVVMHVLIVTSLVIFFKLIKWYLNFK